MFSLEVVEHVQLVAAVALAGIQDDGIHTPLFTQGPHTLLVGIAGPHSSTHQQAAPGGDAGRARQAGQAAMLEELVMGCDTYKVAVAVQHWQEAFF